ncbi:hypothetical protein G7Z17_g6438 [Cylindrodendrum hubeiense]|uniref:NAD-dependent epimerase/dehydratase domain-containing protein n=1 Tax=Cylindrodendrum hubeiense TaxID=595255 RepID=A0A9P5HCC3_9HYPO|nr:hypothetical protein G7Z17_g6438 [Cylindrodendrum hubeiense]
MNKPTSLVTGASGYIALHVVSQLLDLGWIVHATVRNLHNEEKIGPLRQLDSKHPGKLKLFEADLLQAGSFLPAMQNCSVVFHIASPFLVPEAAKDSAKELVIPALEGTRNVLQSVEKTESVKRVIFTSSTGAIYSDNIDVIEMENQTLHEKYFNTNSTVDHNPYQFSKVVAEREAWRIAEAQKRWDMVAICPGFVIGPMLSAVSDSGSLFTIDQLLSGYMLVGVPDLAFALVDVREVAAAHVRAAEVESAQGRYIVSRSKMMPFVDISMLLKPMHPSSWQLPSWMIPNWILHILGPLMGLSRRWLDSNLSITFSVDNTRSIEEFGIEYRPVAQSLADHYYSWAAHKASKRGSPSV